MARQVDRSEWAALTGDVPARGGGAAAHGRAALYLKEFIYQFVLEGQLPHKTVNLVF